MSEQSQGPGWWKASDGKWYPPEQAPVSPPPATTPISSQPTEYPGAPPAGPPAGSPAGPPAGPPGGPPPGPPAGPPGAAPPGPPPSVPPASGAAAAGGAASNTGKIVAVVVALALIGGGAAFALTRGGGSSGSTKSFCDNANKFLNDGSLTNSLNDSAQIDKFVATVDQLTKSSPSEIKSDMQVIDDFVKKLAPGIKAAGNDPDKAIKALNDASSAVGASRLQTAENNVQKFGEDKCGVDLKLNNSTSSDTGSSRSSSSFGTDSSLSFDSTDFTFDSSSFSSVLSEASSFFGSDFFSEFSSSS